MHSTRRYRELDIFNAISCLLVILIHVLSVSIYSLERGSWQQAVVFFPWKLAGFVVPAFLFSGAVKLGTQITAGSLPAAKDYIIGRVKKIFLPYSAYFLVYYAVFIIIGYIQPSPADFVKRLFLGTLSSPFYYIIIVMQFYLLMPLWKLLVKRVPWLIAVAGAGFITLLMMKAENLLGVLGVDFKYADRVFPTYLIFWVSGLYFSADYVRLRDAVTQSPAGVAFAAALVFVFSYINYAQYVSGVYVYDANFLKPAADLLSIFVLLFISVRIENSKRKSLGRILCRVHTASFSVYLSHALFLTLAEYFYIRRGVTEMTATLFIRALAAYTLPFALFAALNKIKPVILPKAQRK